MFLRQVWAIRHVTIFKHSKIDFLPRSRQPICPRFLTWFGSQDPGKPFIVFRFHPSINIFLLKPVPNCNILLNHLCNLSNGKNHEKIMEELASKMKNAYKPVNRNWVEIDLKVLLKGVPRESLVLNTGTSGAYF